MPYPLRPDKVKKAQSFYEKGQYSESLEISQSALDGTLTKERQARAYWLLGKSYEALGASDKALSAYQVAVTLYPHDASLLVALGDLLDRVGLSTQAKAQYLAAVASDPRKTSAHIGLANVLLKEGLFEQAESEFKAALGNEPDTPDLLEATLGLGRAQTGGGWLDAAEDTLRGGLKAGGGVEMRVALAEVLKKKKRLGDAIEQLLEASRQSPRQDLRLRCAAWLMADGRGQEAADILHADLAADPDDALARYFLGLIELRSGDPAQAAKDFKAAAVQEKEPFLKEVADRTLAITR